MAQNNSEEQLEHFLEGYYNVGIGAASRQNINSYGDVIKQNIDMFEKLRYGNLQGSPLQKHGDAAEVLLVKDINKQKIVSGSSERAKMSASKTDEITDIFIQDELGTIVEQGQVKYYKTPEDTAKALSNPKYSQNNAKYAPPEQVDKIIQHSKEHYSKLRSQALELKRQGRMDKYRAKLEEAKAYKHTAETVKPGTRSYNEAQNAAKGRDSRYSVAAKEMLRDSHEAGLKGAKVSAQLTAGVSGAQNLYRVVKGDKELGKAIVDTAVDTAKGAAMGYAINTSGAIVKAGSQKLGEKLGSEVLQAFSKSARGPALFVTSTIEVGKSVQKYLDGDLGAKELFIELGEKGTGILCAEVGTVVGEAAGVAAGASIGALVGTFILPGLGTAAGAAAGTAIGAVIGPIVGSMVGYMVGTQIYQSVRKLMSSFDGEKYQRLKMIYEQAYERMKQERETMERLVEQYFSDREQQFKLAFKQIEHAALSNDVEGISKQLSNIVGAFGEKLQFKNFQEFNDFMLDNNTVLKL